MTPCHHLWSNYCASTPGEKLLEMPIKSGISGPWLSFKVGKPSVCDTANEAKFLAQLKT
jgi:hypothetical protein